MVVMDGGHHVAGHTRIAQRFGERSREPDSIQIRVDLQRDPACLECGFWERRVYRRRRDDYRVPFLLPEGRDGPGGERRRQRGELKELHRFVELHGRHGRQQKRERGDGRHL